MPPPCHISQAQRLNGSTAQRLNGSTAQRPIVGKGPLQADTDIHIEWSWDGLRRQVEMLQVQVDRGQGGTALAFDTTPGYTDAAPHPAALTTSKYRAIWRLDD